MTTKGRTRPHSSADKARRVPKREHQDKLEALGVRIIKKGHESSSFFQIKKRRSVARKTLIRVQKGASTKTTMLLKELGTYKRSTLLSTPPKGSKFLESGEMTARWKVLLERATQVMGSLTDAREWLDAPKYVLGNETPIDLAQTEEGYEEVCQLLGRIEHGVFS